jgi:hypothetical protein
MNAKKNVALTIAIFGLSSTVFAGEQLYGEGVDWTHKFNGATPTQSVKQAAMSGKAIADTSSPYVFYGEGIDWSKKFNSASFTSSQKQAAVTEAGSSGKSWPKAFYGESVDWSKKFN